MIYRVEQHHLLIAAVGACGGWSRGAADEELENVCSKVHSITAILGLASASAASHP